MYAVVNGKPQQWSSLTYRGLGFGQPLPDGCPALPYELQLTAEELRERFSQPFDEFVRENREDDEATGCSDAIPSLVRYGYPTYDEFVQRDKVAFADLLRDLLPLEMLAAFFPTDNPSEWRFAINTVEVIQIEGGLVTIAGSAYRIVSVG